ncbi:MAG: glycosyltransferase family 4 protein [Nitrosarchaeum sp.]|nr:glycosyltransferase family 4 protein [Nitrosarchaeum sp.]
MKILYFTQLFYPAVFGGGEYIFYHWARELVKKGHQVFVITQSLQGQKSHETVDGINIFRVGTPLNLSGTLPVGIFANLSYLIKSYLLGKKIIKENKIDIIHSNTYIPVISAQWCAKKIPHIATIHDVYHTSKNDFWKTWSKQKQISNLTKFLGPLVEKKIAKTNVTLFHTVSNQSKDDIESLGVRKKIKVIPNGIDPTIYDVATEQKKFQAIYVGRLIFYKNIDVIIDAFDIVTKKIPSSKLVIAGDGPMRDQLVKKINKLNLQNNISLVGNVTDEQKFKLIKESTVLLNPSLIEGFGIVVLEGFAAGRPVIVSDSKPLSELVNNSVDGFILKHDDPDLWAQKIIQLFSDDLMAKKMGEAGKHKVIENYSISPLVNQLVDLYKSVL